MAADGRGVQRELLLVTGPGPKGKLDSLASLQRLAKEPVAARPAIAVAFNPFFPDDGNRADEQARLRGKLATGLVSRVYLQSALRTLAALRSASPKQFDVCGSVFLPTRKLIAQQKFRPWNGVFLSDEFLASEDGARGVVVQMLRLYAEHGCDILIEAPGVRNENDWSVVESLLAERDALLRSESHCDSPRRVESKDATSGVSVESVLAERDVLGQPKSSGTALRRAEDRDAAFGVSVESTLTERVAFSRSKSNRTAPGNREGENTDFGLSAEKDASVPTKMGGKTLRRHEDPDAEFGISVDSVLAERAALMHSKPNSKAALVKRRKPNLTSSHQIKVAGKSSLPPPQVSPACLGKPAVVLFHSHDVRLHDNVALQMASHHVRVVPVFLWSKREQGKWGVIGCLEVILKDALHHLGEKLERFDLKLVCREGEDSPAMLRQVCVECDAGAVYWNKEHTMEARRREARYRAALAAVRVEGVEGQSSLLYDPASPSLATGFHGGHWGTLMPFLKGCKKQLGEPRVPLPRFETFSMLKGLRGPATWPSSIAIGDLDMAVIRGKDDWAARILKSFQMSEEDAQTTMNKFFERSGGFARYEHERSRADIDDSTSRLSAHLRIGTLAPNELYYKVEGSNLDYTDRKTFSRRLIWRDLAYFHLLSFPEMGERSIRQHYENTEWCSGKEEEKRLQAWKRGQTGFPLVDAGMRELYATGWMTQSIRMVVASFLVEYLRVNWVKGCEWFHYTLADADAAINPMMWQNAGRSGIDQWNFVLSPVAASQDKSGRYTRKWVPELSKLPDTLLHKPWEAPARVLQKAGVVLGDNYPLRIISDLKAERVASLGSVLAMRRKNQQFNNNRGYDLIPLPGGQQTVVFTKKEFRIDKQGRVLKDAPMSPKGASGGVRGRKRRTVHKKLPQMQAR